MNVIVIMLDSFRQDHMGCYRNDSGPFDDVPACRTPNIDRFAGSAVVFENAYPDALPTIPVRCALMTGQRTLPFHGWQPLLAEQIPIARILRDQGYVSCLISDTYHFRRSGYNFHEYFSSYLWVRGQEYDPYNTAPSRRNIDDYVNQHFDAAWRRRISVFLQNTDGFETPQDWFAAQVMDQAIDWLRKNRSHKKTFLWIDCFEPHEPWDPPKGFDTYTDRSYRGPRLIMPMGGQAADWASPEQIRFIRGLYAGEAAFVDHCVGRLFDALRELGLYEDSQIWLLADHGHPLADHGKFLKGGDRMYSELLNVPFMVRLPGGAEGGRRCEALVQFHDFLPTALELLGMGNVTDAMHGRSFLPVIRGQTDRHREAIITGYHQAIDRCIRDRRFSYIERPEGEPDELYDLADDPRETRNLIDQLPREAQRLKSSFGQIYRRRPSTVVKGIQGTYEMGSAAVE